MQSTHDIIRTAAVCALTFSIFGCGGTSVEEYKPTETTAREALDAALTAWKSGQAHGTVKGFAVPIDTFDSRWQNGGKLESYEITGDAEADGHRKFTVKMKLAGEAEASEVVYLVVGKDPLLVFRQQDYDKASGMGGG